MSLIKGILQGKWLKHPLHPAIVHIPMALWPSALVFDILSKLGLGGNAMVHASFYSILVGLLAALLAVPTGLADWSEIKRDKPAWKIGLLHMVTQGPAKVNLKTYEVFSSEGKIHVRVSED